MGTAAPGCPVEPRLDSAVCLSHLDTVHQGKIRAEQFGTTGSRFRGYSIYNHRVMKNATIVCVLTLALCGLAACNKPSGPAAPSSGAASSTSPDAVQQKLQEYSGAGATNCGRLDVHAAEPQLKTASDCAMQANQSKHPFYVAYDMPGMTVGVAGSAEGKLFTVQSQSEGASPSLTSGACPAQLRIASSGRVTCFAPGDMGSMSGSHGGGAVPPGMPNPHGTGAAKPPSGKP
ncbi:MAG: hypothetical protein ACLQBK_08520 [Candidatus Sulfotelmatobacter sp.]